jgi:hypothetical protein
MRGVPPGEYLLAALTDLDPQDLFSAMFFEQLVPWPWQSRWRKARSCGAI